jgi:2-methylcitrate dehydratase
MRGLKRSLTELLLEEITHYLLTPKTFPNSTLKAAHWAFADALGCANKSLKVPHCRRLLPPWFSEKEVNPIEGAFAWSLLIRWLDYNDTWLAKEYAHPSDNLGVLLALTQEATVADLLQWMVEAYEIQGVLSLSWSCHARGFDHTYFLKISSGALASKLMGGGKREIMATLSHLFADGAPLRVFRQGQNTTSRKSWAAADAASRALFLANLVSLGEPGIPLPLSDPKWGVQERMFGGEGLKLVQPLGHAIMDQILFKVRFPVEFHAQTAVEAALKFDGDPETIGRIIIYTHAAAKKIIDKNGPLTSPADRDHCLQYAVAIALLFGDLKAVDYEEERAQDPRIDLLRKKMTLIEDPHYTALYHDPRHRSIASRLEIYVKGEDQPMVFEVLNPLGHPSRREEAFPFLKKKLEENLGDTGFAEQLLSPTLLSLKVKDVISKIYKKI